MMYRYRQPDRGISEQHSVGISIDRRYGLDSHPPKATVRALGSCYARYLCYILGERQQGFDFGAFDVEPQTNDGFCAETEQHEKISQCPRLGGQKYSSRY